MDSGCSDTDSRSATQEIPSILCNPEARDNVAVTLYIREVLGSNLGWQIGYPDVLHAFRYSLQANSGEIYLLRWGHAVAYLVGAHDGLTTGYLFLLTFRVLFYRLRAPPLTRGWVCHLS
jgi:hypothetical protein